MATVYDEGCQPCCGCRGHGVNYYEHHLGDYLRDTAHLSMVEDGAYRRLLDAYYIKESPLPADLKEVCRLVRAQTKQDRAAVVVVLREFFAESPLGWRHNRCDREIARFQDKQVKAQRSANARWSAHRTQGEGNAIASAEAMRTHSEGNAPRARPQTPITSNQTPDTTTSTRACGDPLPARASLAGAVCIALKAEGIGLVNPGHPELLALIEGGAEVQNFVSAARQASDKGKGFAYVLGIVKGQMRDAHRLAAEGVAAVSAPLGSSGGQARAARMVEANPSLANRYRPIGEIIDAEACDVTSRKLG